MGKSLVTLVETLTKAFQQFEAAENADIVLAIGNTGCGKSTMLSSLVDGPSSLQIKTIKEELDVLDNPESTDMKSKQMQRRTTVKSRTIIEKREVSNYFQIGHSQSQSETFYPTFQFEKSSDLLFIDIAGLNDTGGTQIELINRLMLKNIIARCKSVRILLPITYYQLHTSRGTSLRPHLHTLCSLVPAS